MLDFLNEPWPWYISGPVIGMMVPLLLVFGNKNFGISSSLRHICAMCAPLNIKYFNYDWKSEKWNLFFVGGIVIGGFLAGQFMMDKDYFGISVETIDALQNIGVSDFSRYLPGDIFAWENLFTIKGFIFMVFGGFMVGFGTRYANGCTSGHSISGLSNLQLGSLAATVAFFVGGLIMTHFILPYII
jgi:uncharacterized protein